MLRIVGGFKDQEKRLAFMDAQVKLEKVISAATFKTYVQVIDMNFSKSISIETSGYM